MKTNDFARVRFDVVPNKSVRRIEGATGTGRSLQRPEPHLSGCRESIARAQASPRRVPGTCTLICLSAFARGYAFAKQLFMRKIRMRERGTERALTGCLVRYAKGAPIPQTPHESSYRKEDSMRNRLLATTAAMLVGMTFAAAQNMPNAQSERGSAGADRQQQGRDMQRGAQDSGSAAQDKRGQSQRSEQRQQRDQTTGQSQAKRPGPERARPEQAGGPRQQRAKSEQGEPVQAGPVQAGPVQAAQRNPARSDHRPGAARAEPEERARPDAGASSATSAGSIRPGQAGTSSAGFAEAGRKRAKPVRAESAASAARAEPGAARSS